MMAGMREANIHKSTRCSSNAKTLSPFYVQMYYVREYSFMSGQIRVSMQLMGRVRGERSQDTHELATSNHKSSLFK